MQKFKFITHNFTNPNFNLASEEYLLKHTDEFYIYLWVNAPSVIVGVNQNAIEEVNHAYCKDNGIQVVRRLTGGGAVYHDLNNLCYTVIAPYVEGKNYYVEFTTPVINYLKSLGISATFTGRNDLTIDDKKISGNAQTVFNNRIMHHGTLLFDTDLTVLEKALKPNKLKMQSKGIKSVRSRVTTIKENLSTPLTLEQFKAGLEKEFLKSATPYTFSDLDIERINTLVKDKYSTYEWNIGRSPNGTNVLEKKFDFGVLNITFDTLDGIVENAVITGDFFCKQDISAFVSKLNGTPYIYSEMLTAFKDVDKFIVGANGEQIVKALFE